MISENIYLEMESNAEQTIYYITIGSVEPMDDLDVVEFLKQIIAEVEDGSREIDTHDSIIEEQ